MKKNVLVIEDEPVIGEMMCILLEMAGYNVISLCDTGLARSKLHNKEVDLVMLDVGLEGEDGSSMCRYIKTRDDLKHIPVVLVSAHHELEKVKNICGADDFIRKPFNLHYFINKVNTYAPATTSSSNT